MRSEIEFRSLLQASAATAVLPDNAGDPMMFVSEKKPYRVIDADRGWEMTAKHSMDVTNFVLTHKSGARIVFTGKRVPSLDPSRPREDGYVSEWQITAVGFRPAGADRLTLTEQRALMTEAMSAYGFSWGEGAGPALLQFS